LAASGCGKKNQGITEVTAVRIKGIREIAMLLLNIRAMAETVLKA
jgi:hypothetical protein